MTRQCGDCTACCTALETVSPKGEPCPHDCGQCAIYSARPAPCKAYRCLWLDGYFGKNDRPDRLGVIFDRTSRSSAGPLVTARETRAGALASPGVTRLLERLRLDGKPVVVFRAEGEAEVVGAPGKVSLRII